MNAALRTSASRLPGLAVGGLIRLYQLLLSPFLGNRCRFHPSCSHYALEAVHRFGAMQGSWLAMKRLGRCHPFHPGGFDPVPEVPVDHPGRDFEEN